MPFKLGMIPWNKGTKGTMPVPWNKGKTTSKEHKRKTSEGNIRRFRDPTERLKISLSHKRGDHIAGCRKQSETLKRRYESGEIKPWNKGVTAKDDSRIRPCTLENKLKKAMIGKKRWDEDAEYRYKVVSRSLKALFGKRPTSLEKKFIQFIEKYSLPFRYVGDGSLIISNCNPDFVSTDGRYLLIEVANRFHHQEWYESKRYAIFAHFGYRTCTLWQELFKGEEWEQKVRSYLVQHNFVEQSRLSDWSQVAVCRRSILKKQ